MRSIIKSIACFIALFMMSATTMQAQGYLTVKFNNGNNPLVFEQNSIERLEFVYKNQIVEQEFYGELDTLYITASRVTPTSDGIYGANGGRLLCGEEISAATDCDWLKVEMYLDSASTAYGNGNYYYYSFFADKNVSQQQRVGSLTSFLFLTVRIISMAQASPDAPPPIIAILVIITPAFQDIHKVYQ